MRLLIFLAPIALTACDPSVRVEPIKPPANLTTCADEPGAPELVAYRWAEIAANVSMLPTVKQAVDEALKQAREIALTRDKSTMDYVLAYRSAYGSCRGAVDGVKRWSEGL